MRTEIEKTYNLVTPVERVLDSLYLLKLEDMYLIVDNNSQTVENISICKSEAEQSLLKKFYADVDRRNRLTLKAEERHEFINESGV